MKIYSISGKVNNATGFGWLGFAVKGATYTGTLKINGDKNTYDSMFGNVNYEAILTSVKAYGIIDVTSLVVSKLGGKNSGSGQIKVNGVTNSSIINTNDGYKIAYNITINNYWKQMIGKVDVSNKAVANTDFKADLISDDVS